LGSEQEEEFVKVLFEGKVIFLDVVLSGTMGLVVLFSGAVLFSGIVTFFSHF
jgi:hypothetical protein